MILESGVPEHAEPLLGFLIPSGVDYTRLERFSKVETMLPRASGLILGVPDGSGLGVVDDVRRIRRRDPWLPIVIAGPVPRSGFETVHRLALMDAGADQVISWTDSHFGDGTIAHSWRTLPLRRLAATVQRATHLSDVARTLMVRALAAPRPIAAVADLAEQAQLHRASLWKQWATSQRGVPSPGLFVDWLQLLHIAVRKDMHRTWAAASQDIGALPSSVARLGKRLLGSPLSTYDAQARRRIFAQFLKRMVKLSAAEIQDFTPVAPPLLAAVALELANRQVIPSAVAAPTNEAGAEQVTADDSEASARVAQDTRSFGIGGMWLL